MKNKTIRLSRWSLWSLLLLLAIVAGAGSAQAAGEIGKTVDRSNVQEYKDMLNPALYRAVERGDFILKTGKLNFEYKLSSKFLEVGEKNAGEFDINAKGDMVDKAGKLPMYLVHGLPFPHIDHTDPTVASKIMWNFYFAKQRIGGMTVFQRLYWVSNQDGVHRYINGDVYRAYIQGRPPQMEVPASQNPDKYSMVEMGLMKEPFSMRNVNSLNFEFLDEQDNIQMSYAPSIRRIRQTSGVSRSDPYLGSDGWADATMLWGGKNRTMNWRLAGEQTILVPFASPDKTMVKKEPDGAMYLRLKATKYGYDTPGWKGAKWAPTSYTWTPRKCWLIEQRPKDPYYNWGLHRKWVDKETYKIHMQEVYTKAGEFRTWQFCPEDINEAPDGDNNAVNGTDTALIDETARHATVTLLSNFKIYMNALRLPLKFFAKSNFLVLSK